MHVRPKGIYEAQYQARAQNCNSIVNKVTQTIWSTSAATRVQTMLSK